MKIIEKTVDELPRYLRYDIFMALLGGFMFYFSFTNKIISQNPDFRQVLVAASLIITSVGILKMKEVYDLNRSVWELEYQLRLKHLKKKLKEH